MRCGAGGENRPRRDNAFRDKLAAAEHMSANVREEVYKDSGVDTAELSWRVPASDAKSDQRQRGEGCSGEKRARGADAVPESAGKNAGDNLPLYR